MDLTIIIITRNHQSDLFDRLKYYNNFEIEIIIADSSEHSLDENEIKKICKRAHYFKSDNWAISPLAKIRSSINNVKSDYFLIVPDDDVFCLEGIKNCVKFLDENREYGAVQGKWIGFCEELNRKYIEVYNEPGQEREEDTPLDRFCALWNHPSQWFYCVARTKSVCSILNRLGAHDEEIVFCEAIIASAMAMSGKLKILEVPFGVSKIHEASIKGYKKPPELRSESEQGLNRRWESFENDLANLLVELDNRDEMLVRKMTHEALLMYGAVPSGTERLSVQIKGYLKKIPLVKKRYIHSYFLKRSFKSSPSFPFSLEILKPVEGVIWH